MNERTTTKLLSPSPDGKVSGVAPLGRVAAPPEYESTSGVFFFWVDRSQSVERTQIVTTSSSVAERTVKFVGIVQEVYRRSRQKDIGEESARFDGRSSERPPFDSEGVTYAEVAILRTDPVAHTPPTEESEVYLATPSEAARGYGLDRMGQRLDVGLLRNGGTQFAGRAAIDLDFLLVVCQFRLAGYSCIGSPDGVVLSGGTHEEVQSHVDRRGTPTAA
jgi:hypothetical protein